MKIFNLLKTNKFLALILLAYLFLFVAMPNKALVSVNNSRFYIIEMIKIMPVIFVLTSIIEAWVPKQVIINGFGESAGVKGNIFSFVIGSISAGPIYAAFPLCKMLLNKGASIANITIILSAWAVIKVPMLISEANFLGVQFMVMRWVLTVLSIILMSYIVSNLVKKESIPINEDFEKEEKDAVYIKDEYCTGCSLCVLLSPDQFVMENKKARWKHTELDKGAIEEVEEIREKCPTKAININKAVTFKLLGKRSY